MRLTSQALLRRVFFSNFHPFLNPPKTSKWPARERLKRFNASLVDLTEKMMLENGQYTHATESELAHVEFDSSLFRDPFPEAKIYPKGPEKHHKVKPRKLTIDEY